MNLKKKFQPDPALDIGQSIAFLRMRSIHKTATGYELKPVFSLKDGYVVGEYENIYNVTCERRNCARCVNGAQIEPGKFGEVRIKCNIYNKLANCPSDKDIPVNTLIPLVYECDAYRPVRRWRIIKSDEEYLGMARESRVLFQTKTEWAEFFNLSLDVFGKYAPSANLKRKYPIVCFIDTENIGYTRVHWCSLKNKVGLLE